MRPVLCPTVPSPRSVTAGAMGTASSGTSIEPGLEDEMSAAGRLDAASTNSMAATGAAGGTARPRWARPRCARRGAARGRPRDGQSRGGTLMLVGVPRGVASCGGAGWRSAAGAASGDPVRTTGPQVGASSGRFRSRNGQHGGSGVGSRLACPLHERCEFRVGPVTDGFGRQGPGGYPDTQWGHCNGCPGVAPFVVISMSHRSPPFPGICNYVRAAPVLAIVEAN